jgi:NAD(P)-dependent dehydrogenase (short-subunit alcohol dehydrogenase family)
MRRVLLTGGTGIIGSKLVSELTQDGYFVYFTTRTKERGEHLINNQALIESQVKALILDFNNQNAINNLVRQLDYLPDILIHNARSLDSIMIGEDGVISNENFQKEFFNGVTFPYSLTNKILDLGAPIADIIFISSMYGVVAPSPRLYDDFENQSPINYGVVKAAQIHLVKELAVRFAKKNIRVNSISYGGVEGRVNQEFKERYASLTPMKRMLNLHDLYPPIKYIISNQNMAVTGENLKVDGGWTIW